VLAVQDDRVVLGVLPEGSTATEAGLTGAMTLEQFMKELKARLD
jgi:hypothetical protein